MIHPLADCQAIIPDDSNVWQFCVVLPQARIGHHCNICSHCFIENDVLIGDNVTVKCGVQLWDGITLEDEVFIGSNVTFTNDRYPRSKKKEWKLEKTVVRRGASVGAGSVVLCGIEIGENAMIGAGSVVTKNVPACQLWVGNPARFVKMIG